MARVNVLKGNIDDKQDAVAEARTDCKIEYMVITNKSLNAVYVNLKIKDTEDREIHMCPMNMRLEESECFTDRNVTLLQGDQYVLQVEGGNVDYYLSIVEYGDNS